MTDENKKYIGDDFVEESKVEDDEKKVEMYDLVLPPGIPYKVIYETVEKFGLEITTHKCALKTIDVESENLLVLRGELDAVNNAHDYIYQKMSEKYNYKR